MVKVDFDWIRSATRPPRRAGSVRRVIRPFAGPMVGLGVQLAVLTALTQVGINLAGWLLGLGYGLGVTVLLGRGLVRAGRSRLGPADKVTLVRSTFVGGVLALVASDFGSQAQVAALVGLAAVALVLDGVDGRVARRTGTASVLGARFDMEIDAMLILILSVNAGRSVGWWVLFIGAARPLFLAAALVWPWLRGDLPVRYWAKVVAVLQGIVLIVVAVDVLPVAIHAVLCLMALALLVESFGRSIWWLAVHRDLGAGRPAGLRNPRSMRVDG